MLKNETRVISIKVESHNLQHGPYHLRMEELKWS